MRFLLKIKKIATNKVVFYMITRYVVYFITFLSSMIIAARMGPYYLGIWGFAMLLVRYFSIIDFGLGNSITVLLVQNKNNEKNKADYEISAMVILGIISLCVILLAACYYFFGISLFKKYELGAIFYYVCIIAILQYFNNYFFRVYRVKGKMFEFTFYQSFTSILVLAAVFFAREERLVYLLVWVHIIANYVSLLLFLRGKGIALNGKFSWKKTKEIVSKGMYLFVYNFCFYMIIISTKTIIGAYYAVEEFGYFTFAYTVAHAAILLLTAFAALITPKLLDMFNSSDNDRIESTIRLIRVNYVCLSHGMMYVAMFFFPLLLFFLPKYADTLRVINLSSLATILYANSFGYISFLMTRNKEKMIAINSLICFLTNVVLALFLVIALHITYEYVIIATLVSYFIFTYLIVYCGKKILSQKAKFRIILKDSFPVRILIPFMVAVVVTVINSSYVTFLPLVIFVSINTSEIKEIYRMFKRILYNPNVIDI